MRGAWFARLLFTGGKNGHDKVVSKVSLQIRRLFCKTPSIKDPISGDYGLLAVVSFAVIGGVAVVAKADENNNSPRLRSSSHPVCDH